MSSIAQLNKLETEMKLLQEKMAKLQQDPSLAKELEVRSEFEALLKKHGIGFKDVANLLGHGDGKVTSSPKGTRRPRSLKKYKNPHTGEVVETRGGNHKVLNAWKSEHGAEAVASWEDKAA